MEHEIKVSISCLTYNHEKYIRNTLDGFVMQKTNFKYEVIVHDDASTDNTAEIVMEYAKKYPDLFVPVIQTENQHSKKVKISSTFVYPKVRGKYIAICEGDDFWTDENKLQKQVDFLDAHPEYSACTHAHEQLDMRTNETREMHAFNQSTTVSTEQIIEGDGHMFATNSLMAKSDIVINRPDFLKNATVGDYPLMIHLAFQGKIYYMDDVMSVYRYMVPGSWTSRNLSKKETTEKHLKDIERTLNEADVYSKGRFHDSFNKIMRKKWFYFHKQVLHHKELKKIYPDYYKSCSSKDRIFILTRSYCPFLLKLYSLIKG